MTKRRQISLLPSVHQTDALTRFFDSTVEQVFQSGKTVPVSGFIGRKPPHYDPSTDFYKPEPTAAREKYQLEPMMVSRKDGSIQSSLFYEDLLSRLGRAGSITTNPERLFKAGYYSWAPPIDIDRIMNFQQYYWAGPLTSSLVLTVPGVEVGSRIYANGQAKKFAIPAELPSRPKTDEQITVLVDGVRQNDFTIQDDEVVLATAPTRDSTVIVFRYGNVADGQRDTFSVPAHCEASEGLDTVYAFLNGRETTDFTRNADTVTFSTPPSVNTHVMITRIKDLAALIEGKSDFSPKGLVTKAVDRLVDGMKIKVVDPQNFQVGYDLKAYGHPWDEVHYSTYFVEGVGLSIILVPLDNISLSGDGLEGNDPRYIVVSRTDKARSYWTRVNRWVHKDSLIDSSDATFSNRAKRPIIEFVDGVQQFHYGDYRVRPAHGKVSDRPIYSGEAINFTEVNGLPLGSVMFDDGFVPAQGSVVLVNLPADRLNSTLYYVDLVDSEDGSKKLYLLEPIETVREGAVTNIGLVEYWFDGRAWNTVEQPGEYPLFDLFDSDGISLSDQGVYPESNFEGSRLFNFAKGSGGFDAEIKRQLVHDKYGQIVFENELDTVRYAYEGGEIQGYYYYQRGSSYENMWHRASDDLAQKIDNNNISEIPLNLQANPDFESPTLLSKNDFFAHFSSIIENQVGFEGQSFAHNNWNNTAKDVTKGLVVIQHEAPLLKLMALMEREEFSLLKAVQFVDREYGRYKLKLLKHVRDLTRERDTSVLSGDALAELALQRVNAGKTSTFPFSDSLVGGGRFFLPLTPSLIGISALIAPRATADGILGHDGSLTPLFMDQRDDALLAFENRIYAAAGEVDYLLPLWSLVNGNYRNTSPYSQSELTQLLSPLFEQWARDNNRSMENTGFDESDAFSFNYRQTEDRFGNPLAGNWRAIYRNFFDTETPNLTPWEMLGFEEEPIWWKTSYGSAPFTRDNTILWDDIEAGVIRQGKRAGTHLAFARPGLMQILPVDQQGELIDPIEATIVERIPPVQFARASWLFGDGSPVERDWRNSSNYQFSLSYAKFLMRPNFFVERFWDVANQRVVHGSQVVDARTLKRNQHRDAVVNTELLPDGTRQKTMGIQNWIIDNLINRGLTASLLGDLVRGLQTQLGHKVAGFTTSDRMFVSAESFGLVPSEDITISLYRSPSINEFSYSGMLIENVAGGWRVIGYNPDRPFFDVMERDINSRKRTIGSDASTVERITHPWAANVYYKLDMLVEYQSDVYRCVIPHTSGRAFEQTFWERDQVAGNRFTSKVTRYESSTGIVTQTPYGSLLTTKQEVADLMFGYEAWLIKQGFVFSDIEDASNSWTTAVRNFLKWSDVEWSEGAFVTLSPAARELTFKTPTGLVAEVTDSLTGHTGHTLRDKDFAVDRFEDTTVITAINEDIYGARLSRVEMEHCIMFANKTIFDDVIYDALFNIRQERLKISAKLASDWQGRYAAPGFVLQGDDMSPNFAKLGEDVREMFDIELADNTVLRDHARHVIGFQSRDYLDRLLLSETQQFELYQGMIQQKGSSSGLSAILRSSQVGQSRDLKFLEEWAFRVGEYGAYYPNFRGEFTIQQSDITNQRQVVSLVSTPHWFDASTNFVSSSFDFSALLVQENRESFADGGYARVDEATYILPTRDHLGDLISSTEEVFDGEVVWLTHELNWSIARLSYPSADLNRLVIIRIDDENSGGADGVEDFRIYFDRAHDLSVGDTFYLTGGTDPSLRGVRTVLRSGTDWVETFDLSQALYDIIAAEPPQILRMDALRFKDTADLAAVRHHDTLVYVDGPDGWKVYRSLADDWVEVRRQPKKLDVERVSGLTVYDPLAKLQDEGLLVQPALVDHANVLDPASGLIPGIADRELDYKLEYDPADYDTWGPDEVGRLWWNLDTARFINCYTDAVEEMDPASVRYVNEINYRAAQWTKLLPSSSVDIYEWVRSGTVPEGVEDYITRQEYDNRLLRVDNFYYYWSLNPTSVPRVGTRKLSAYSVSRIIMNPDLSGFVWCAPISDRSLIVSGLRPYLTDEKSICQISYQQTDYDGQEHSEWVLMRPKDEATPPPTSLWNKLIESLVGYTLSGEAVPSSTLHREKTCGLREGQSLFGNVPVAVARKSFIEMVNYILARKNLSSIGLLEEKISLADMPSEYCFWSHHSGELGVLPLSSEYDLVVYDEQERDAAIKRVERVLLDNRQSEMPSFSIWEADQDGNPVLAKAYHYVVDTIEERDALFGEMRYKDRVLVRADHRADGFWTIWRKNGDGAWAIDPFEKFAYDAFKEATLGLSDAQKYRTRDLWQYTDWYDESVSATNPPSTTYATVAERTQAEGENPQNLLVRVLDDAGYWTWTAYTGSEWITVARENGTIQLSANFFESTKRYGFDGHKLDLDITKIRGRDGSFELSRLMAALSIALTPSDMNELWFSMIHFVHAHINKVDWAVKTSFMSVLGYNERLWQSPVAMNDNLPLLLQYIDEVKPYRAKIREVLQTAAPDIDRANTIATDFDKPVFYDNKIDSYRRLDNQIDTALLASGVYRHFTNHAENVRKFKIGMTFDRIWDQPTVGSGAAARIMAFYQPGSNMRSKSLDDLMSLDFRGTIYQGKNLTDLESDIVLKGSSAANSIEPVNVDNGLQVRDPRAYGKPEELVKFGMSDGLVVHVRDRWGAGAPLHTVRHFDVSRRKAAHASLDINAIAESVAVFRDGVRAASTEYTFNQATHMVDVNLVRPDGERVRTVAIHAFGYAAIDQIVDQQFYAGAASYELQDAFSGALEARVDGKLLDDSQISTNLNTVTLTPPRSSSEVVMLTRYSSDDPKPTRQEVTVLPYNTDKAWQLTNLPSQKPYHASMIVEVNGVRLTPEKTLYVSNELSVYVGDTAASKLRVYDDQTKDSYPVVNFSDVSSATFDDISDVIKAIEGTRFVLWDNRVVFGDLDANGRDYVVTIEDRNQFTVSDAGALHISAAAVKAGDRIEVTTWEHDDLMNIRTHVHRGSARGVYPLRTTQNGRSWLTLRGKRLVENVDYVITGYAGGAWDIDPFEAYTYDAFTDVQIALRLPAEADGADLVITTFEGRENNPARAWQLSSALPSEMRMLPTTEGERPLYVVKDAWEIIALHEKRRSASLDAVIGQEDDSISMTLNPLSLPAAMIPSQPMAVPTEKTPGVIWLGGERIEYFDYSRSGNHLTIGQLRRGTRGTAKLVHEAGQIIYAGDAILDRLPPCPRGEKGGCCSC